MGEILNIPDNIPQNLLDKTRCWYRGYPVGSQSGLHRWRRLRTGRPSYSSRRIRVCPGHEAHRRCTQLEGGSFGLQLGAQATDFVFLIMNERGATSLLHSKVKLGGDATVAAGPVGRDAEADTDVAMRAEI